MSPLPLLIVNSIIKLIFSSLCAVNEISQEWRIRKVIHSFSKFLFTCFNPAPSAVAWQMTSAPARGGGAHRHARLVFVSVCCSHAQELCNSHAQIHCARFTRSTSAIAPASELFCMVRHYACAVCARVIGRSLAPRIAGGRMTG